MQWFKRLFLPPLFAAPLVAIVLNGTQSVIEPVSLAWIAAALVAVCCPMVALGLIGSKLRGGLVLQALAGLGYGALFAFQLRESTGFPPSTAALAAVALVIGVGATALLRLLCGKRTDELPTNRAEQTMPEPLHVGWRWLAVTIVLALALPFGLYASGGMLRWHLLHHTQSLGSPIQKLIGVSPKTRAQELDTLNAVAGDEAAQMIANRFAPGTTPFIVEAASPSIVFVLIDTLRADAFAAFGGEQDLMPRLAETLGQCQRFTDVLANTSWTRPSIASMFTGLIPEHHGAHGIRDPLDTNHTSFVEVLNTAGYETIALQSNPTAGSSSGLYQGFDEFVEVDRDPYPRAEVLNKATLAFLDQRSGELARSGVPASAPLFLYLQYLDPHEPYLSGENANGWSAASYQAAYRAELAYLDQQLSAVLPQVRERLGPETLFFFISDHGEEFFEHDLFGHGHTLYNEVVEIPAALCGGPFAGGNINARLEGRDVFSLMLGLANGSLRSNTDLLRWSQTNNRPTRYLSLSFEGFGNLQLRPYLQSTYQRAVETEHGKWIWSAYGNTWEFYAKDDRTESHNLAGSQGEPPTSQLDTLAPAPWYRPEAIALSDKERKKIDGIGYVN